MFKRLSDAVIDQLHWIEDHGENEEGYIATYGDEGRAIYAADLAHLHKLTGREVA